MKAYSQDVRKRVLRAVDLGRPRSRRTKVHGSGWPLRRKAVNSSSYLGILPTSPPLKKRSLSSKPPCDEQEREHEKPWKKPLPRRYSPLPLRMHRDGSSIAVIFPLMKGRGNCSSIFEHTAVG